MTFNSLGQRLAPWALPVALLAAWQGAVVLGLLSTRILPAPSAVAVAGWALLTSGELWQHLAISGWRAGIGFAIGGALASRSASSPACRSGANACSTARCR